MTHFIRLMIAALMAVLAYGSLLQDVGGQDATGTVTVQKYFCTYLNETLLVEAIDLNECVPGTATFTFYLVGDGTAEFEQLVVPASGSGTIVLPVGSYEMVEEGTQTFFNLTVAAGETTNLLIGNPAVVVEPTAAPAQPTAVPPAPQLPNTGAGSSSNASDTLVSVVMVGAAAAAVAACGAMMRYRNQRA